MGLVGGHGGGLGLPRVRTCCCTGIEASIGKSKRELRGLGGLLLTVDLLGLSVVRLGLSEVRLGLSEVRLGLSEVRLGLLREQGLSHTGLCLTRVYTIYKA